MPALREAAETIVRVVKMRGFHNEPPGDAEAWARVHRLLIGPRNEILWQNIPKLAGKQLQRVLTRAYAYELFLRVLRSASVPRLTKVRILAAAQSGAGEWCCLMGFPTQWVRLDDHAFQRGVFARIGHPDPLISMETRCVCEMYSHAAVPRIPGPNIHLVGKPMVSVLEHRLGLHFHKCLLSGMSTQGHNSVSHAWL